MKYGERFRRHWRSCGARKKGEAFQKLRLQPVALIFLMCQFCFFVFFLFRFYSIIFRFILIEISMLKIDDWVLGLNSSIRPIPFFFKHTKVWCNKKNTFGFIRDRALVTHHYLSTLLIQFCPYNLTLYPFFFNFSV